MDNFHGSESVSWGMKYFQGKHSKVWKCFMGYEFHDNIHGSENDSWGMKDFHGYIQGSENVSWEFHGL